MLAECKWRMRRWWCCHVPVEEGRELPPARPLDLARPIVVGEGARRLRFVVLSDTHAHERWLRVPDGDVLLCCGDHCNFNRDYERELRAFDEFLGTLPHKHKLVIGGNHDLALDEDKVAENKALYRNATYLQDELAEVEGLRVYGMPWRPKRGCCFLAENFGADPTRLAAKYRLIPRGVDVLMTHSPPFGVGDRDRVANYGCGKLLDHVLELSPAVHVFGHIHQGHGAWLLRGHRGKDILLVNGANYQNGRRIEQPIVFDLLVPERGEVRGA